MCDLISKAGKRIKSRHPIKSCLKTRKKENMEIKDILHKSQDELMTEEALTSFAISDAYHQFLGQA